MKKWFYCFSIFYLLFFTTGCKKTAENKQSRSFYMGVTPWPADFTLEEVNNSYDFINAHCDIVSHHFDDGIPYEESFNSLPMPVELQNDIQTRKTKTATGKKIFLSVSTLNLTRKEKADYYQRSTIADSIKTKWEQLSFDDTKVITAYIKYISMLIDTFNPIYVNYGVESNLDTWNPAGFIVYKNFLSQVYQQLKIKYPGIPFFISFIVHETPAAYNNALALLPYTDFIGLSAYPYVTVSSSASGNTNPANFPADFFSKFADLDPSKPLVFAETGYIAEDLSIPAIGLNKQGTEEWQKAYLEKICNFCNIRKAKMLIWFCHKDYDAGITTLQSLGLYQYLFDFWTDTGLEDENSRQRPAYQSWLQWMERKKTE